VIVFFGSETSTESFQCRPRAANDTGIYGHSNALHLAKDAKK